MWGGGEMMVCLQGDRRASMSWQAVCMLGARPFSPVGGRDKAVDWVLGKELSRRHHFAVTL